MCSTAQHGLSPFRIPCPSASNSDVVHVRQGSPDVIALLNVDKWPWKNETGAVVSPKYIRATRYTYDFTRWNTTWADRLPYKQLLDEGSSEDRKVV
jgi:hypothetical protein